MFSGSVESQCFVGASSPSGHSISNHSCGRLRQPVSLDAPHERARRAKRDDNGSAVASRHVILRHAFDGRPIASALAEIG